MSFNGRCSREVQALAGFLAEGPRPLQPAAQMKSLHAQMSPDAILLKAVEEKEDLSFPAPWEALSGRILEHQIRGFRQI